MACTGGSDDDEDTAMCSFLFGRRGQGRRKSLHTSPTVVLKRGFLVKQGNFIKSWKRRAFVLTTEELRYYGSTGETGTPKGVIPLKDITKLRQKTDGSFKIVTSTREYVLVATSDKAKREWMKAIHKAQFRPSRLAWLLREAASLHKSGRITADVKEDIKDSLVSGDPTRIAEAEERIRGLHDAGSKLPEAIQLILAQFKSVTKEIGLINVLTRLVEAVTAVDKVPASLAPRVRSIAARHHAENDDRWTPAVQRQFAEAVECINAKTVSDNEPGTSSPRKISGSSAAHGAASSERGTPDSDSPAASSPHAGAGGGSDAGGTPSSHPDAAAAASDSPDDGIGPRAATFDSLASQPSTDGMVVRDMSKGALLAKAQEAKFEDNYVLGAKIGEGGYSVVYEGAHKHSMELVAVKCVEKSRLTPREMTGLIEEVKVMRQLNHPNIVRLIAFYDEPETFYIVTELMTGGELFDQIVEKTHYSEQEAQSIVRTLARALAYCHKKGIVHRDLKPENILLSTADETTQVIKIADMGFARTVRPDGMETSCGTPSYVAPEILRGERYGNTVDMWSLGVISFILLCGYAPFAASNQAKLFRAICRGTFRFASPYWDTISAGAKDLISKLLVVDPAERFTADQVLAHPWVAHRANASNFMLSGVLKQLRRYNTRRRQVIKRGFLVKRGHFVKNWKRRSFVLTNTDLLYYESETSTQPLGVIPLGEIERVVDDKETAFKIFTTAGKKYVIQAATEDEKREWMRSLMSTQQHSDLMNKAAFAVKAREMEEAVSLLSLAEEFASLRDSGPASRSSRNSAASAMALPLPPPVAAGAGQATATAAPVPPALAPAAPEASINHDDGPHLLAAGDSDVSSGSDDALSPQK